MNNSIPVVSIDGPSGAGKGVITQRLASLKGYHILDSGAIYRVIGLAARKDGLDFKNQSGLVELAQGLDISFRGTGDSENPLSVWLRDQDVTREVRTNEAGVDASKLASISELRLAIRSLQRSFKRSPGLVADGRDMGTVVFDEAQVKFFLTASPEARAERRYKQLKDKGIDVSLPDLFLSIQNRDLSDMEREIAPLEPARDAVIIDSTAMTIDEVFYFVLSVVEEKLG
ncbi:MAG: (d)CMP kinase [Gammaproteobacteria bacterium TMED1]|nr:MAG: (d)CMP kinase [Gammaproteobacteria bacterium TMED1]